MKKGRCERVLEVHDATVKLGRTQDGSPDGEPQLALDRVSCTIAPGELVGFVGLNGSGKSTLARLMCGAQMPDNGFVSVDGVTAANEPDQGRIRRLVGRVVQSPTDQIISTVVEDEVAFGLQNLGLDDAEIQERLKKALATVGLAGFEGRPTDALSGGEQQRLALAAVLAMEPAYLVLDEATSQLDSTARGSFRALVRRLKRRGVGVALITHDPLEALMCDRVYCLEGGRVAWEATPHELLAPEEARLTATLPRSRYIDALRVACRSGYDVTRGIEPSDIVSWLAASVQAGSIDGAVLQAVHSACLAANAAEAHVPTARTRSARDDAEYPARKAHELRGVRVQNVSVSHGGECALNDVSITVPAGTVTLVAGPSGAGKTTLAGVIAGLDAPDAGCVTIDGKRPVAGAVGIAFQDPESQLFLESVERELAFAPRNLGFDEVRIRAEVEGVARQLGLEGLLDRDPFALSGGQARRVAIGSILTFAPHALVLDEPTAGLDAPGRTALHGLVRDLAAKGVPVLVISHDLEEWLGVADRVALLNGGRLLWEGAPQELDARIFSEGGLLPPEAAQVALACERIAAGAPAGAPGAEAARAASAKPRGGRVQAKAPALAGIDARVKVLLLLAATIAIFACSAWWTVAVWFAAACAALHLAGARAGSVLRSLKPMLVLFVIVVAVNLISFDGSADIMIAAPFGLSTAGALRSAWAIARIALLACLALAVSASTTPTQLADAFVRLMVPLARAGVPVGDIGLVLSMALRFIPLVSVEAHRIQRAQAARGVSFDEGGVMRRVRAWGAVLTPLVVGLFRRADRIAASMDARLFAPTVRRTRPRALTRCDICVLAAGLCAMAALVVVSYAVR